MNNKAHRFNAKVAEEIIAYLHHGAFVETAAAAAGISKQTFYNWLRRARDPKRSSTALRKFRRDVKQAMALSEARMIGFVSDAAETQWQAAAWHLERKYPQRWGRLQKTEITGAGGGPIKTAPAEKLTTAEARTELEKLIAAMNATHEGGVPEADDENAPKKSDDADDDAEDDASQ